MQHTSNDSILNGPSNTKTARGIVYLLDGAGGSGFTPVVYRMSLAKLPYEVTHFRWGTGYGRLLSDLTDRENMLKKSRELSSSIKEYRIKNEDKKIYVIAKSAGTAVALNALSEVGENTIERVILLSPAVSPKYPLLPVLKAVRQDVVSFWSPHDTFYLGWGTSTFGTADGIFGKGAGLTGFDVPDQHEEIHHYAKLRQIKWQPQMRRYLHFGDHSGNSMPPFVKEFVLPLLES